MHKIVHEVYKQQFKIIQNLRHKLQRRLPPTGAAGHSSKNTFKGSINKIDSYVLVLDRN